MQLGETTASHIEQEVHFESCLSLGHFLSFLRDAKLWTSRLSLSSLVSIFRHHAVVQREEASRVHALRQFLLHAFKEPSGAVAKPIRREAPLLTYVPVSHTGKRKTPPPHQWFADAQAVAPDLTATATELTSVITSKHLRQREQRMKEEVRRKEGQQNR